MGVSVAEEGELVRRRRWPRVLAIAAALVALLVLGLWLARKPIARGQADRFLAQAGVPARYTIENLGFGRQRLTNVVIGDPIRPDLVADWLETRTSWGLSGPYLASVRGGRVRVRARWADGKLSLGSIDRLLPKGQGGKAFSLPALRLDVRDLRARVETPWGVLGAKLSGEGRLDGGFSGRLAVVSRRLGTTGCAASGVEAVLQAGTTQRLAGARVTLAGPVHAAALACAGAKVAAWRSSLDAALSTGERLAWSLGGRLATGPATYPGLRAGGLGGSFDVAGSDRIAGEVDLAATSVATRGVRAGRVALAGDVRGGPGTAGFAGRVGVAGADARALLPTLAGVGRGTPVEPLVDRLAAALRGAAARVGGEGAVTAELANGVARVRLADARLQAASGASATFAGRPALAWRSEGGLVVDAALQLDGGGLPGVAGRVRRTQTGALRADLRVSPYAAGGAQLALSPVTIEGAGDRWRVATAAALSGPLGDGRVEGLRLPIDARFAGGAVTLAGGCAPVRWNRLAVSELALDPAATRLCSDSGALVRAEGGRVSGGARIAATRLTGRLGATPLELSAAGARVRLADRGFALERVDARLGPPGRRTELSAASLSGRVDARGLAGRFSGAAGRIGAAPLVMSGAAGEWRLVNGALSVTGGLTVTDAASPARFQPMAARAVELRLAQGRITADAALYEPTTGTRVAGVAIRHDLSAGRGTADLLVPGLTFAKGFQPELLTRLTFGVIADVRGTVAGEGRIAWSAAGVTSTGAFRTAGADLAAAFGPVTGLAGEIRFTDLLQLQSAPGQRFTVKSINPGVPVTDGVLTLQTLPGARVRVEGARWPFAGGELVLEPTLLDFSAAAERRLTFRVTGAAADKFLLSFDFENLNATGVFDGVLPMVFDASGGRIENGRLTARPGGGTIAYVGDISRKNLGFWGNFAFDALKSLRYRSLGVTVNGPLAGEMVTEVRFAGVTQGEGAKSNFLIRRLQRLPIVFNIRIQAPFRGLLDATASFYDPKRLIERNLPELIEKQNRSQNRAIQPPASETVP